MWIKNSDTGKWSDVITDTLPKSVFDGLEQDISSTILYSKALSGSTYLPINNLTDIYDVLDNKINYTWYVSGSTYSILPGTISSYYKPISGTTSFEYYDKFSFEHGLTLKNKFTPTKIINDSIDNYLEVDVATTGTLNNIGSYSPGLVIDGIKLKPGHRVLVKDQISQISLSYTINPDDFFLGSYTLEQNDITSIIYSYYSSDNGVYIYQDNKLVRSGELETYEDSYRYSVIVKMGSSNKLLQYHLKRLKNGYFPIYLNGDPMEFNLKENWVLKNRVDYHNIYEISYNDIKKFNNESYVDLGTQSKTYTMPSRTISVGDFGMIVNSQNGFVDIIYNKYKETLNSISESDKYYWICGDNGTLLQVSKLDFGIENFDTGEFNSFNSIDFVDDLRGIVVGDYNTIYFTQDGGLTWNKISHSEFDEYSYNKIIFYSYNKAYIGGDSGVFIEMTYDSNIWTLYKRSVIKYLDINEPTEEYLLVDDINDMSVFSYTNWNLSYSSATSSSILSDKEGIVMVTNGGNVVLYSINNFIDHPFLYLSFSQSTSDIQSVTTVSGTSSIYIASDNIYSIDINDFSTIINTTNNIVSNNNAVLDYNIFANKIHDYNGQNLYISGNSYLGYTGYTASVVNIDTTFGYKYNSKMLFMDYEIGSKLNFIDIITQDYRLPNSLTFSSNDITTLFSVENKINEFNWLSYYKDKEKTFQYYTSLDDSNEVLFSSTFSYYSDSQFFFSSDDMNITSDAIVGLAPNVDIPGTSRYLSWGGNIIGTTFSETVFMYKHMLIIRQDPSYVCDIGDVFCLSCDILTGTFILNRKITIGPDAFLYFFIDFGQSIINDLKSFSGAISVSNLNKYSSFTPNTTILTDNIDITDIINYIDYVPENYFAYAPTGSSDLLLNFNLHPVSYGYSLTFDNDIYTLSPKYNNKTAYYNMESLVTTTTFQGYMNYDTPFLKFGYKPTYNLYDYLSGVSSLFDTSKVFYCMPTYKYLPGNNTNDFTPNNIYIDTNSDTNKLIFGSNLQFEWNSIWINTFVDVTLRSGGTSFNSPGMFVMKKYYNSSIDGYVIEFHKKMFYNYGIGIDAIDISSRNKLTQISDDLQVLNNMHRSQTIKSLQPNTSFINLENELNFRFPTDSYTKILMSDKDTRDNLSGIIYIDDSNELALNIVNLESELNISIVSTGRFTYNSDDLLVINCGTAHGLSVGDGITLTFDGGPETSSDYNSSFFGYQIVGGIIGSQSFYTDKKWEYFNIDVAGVDTGNVYFIKRDPFLNYEPVDIMEVGVDKQVKVSVEIDPENYILTGSSYELLNVDFSNYRYTLVDGLSVSSLYELYPWILEADISNAIIGQDSNGVVWYSGSWNNGRWFGGTWISGKWISGDWYSGTWSSYNIKYKLYDVEIDNTNTNSTSSKWYNGRWFDGTWNNGTWYNGRRYAGTWNNGTWYNGIWNGGSWNNGIWKGGIWVTGIWNGGSFNCDNKPSYWIDGTWYNGDFENGLWYNGQFLQKNNGLSRFGTKAFNTRTAIWQSGKFSGGEFHSYLNTDINGNTIASEFNKYSVWYTGIFNNGFWYGGIAYAIDFNTSNWYGGVIEEIQIIGIDIEQGKLTQFTLNGSFNFNINDDIWVVNDNNPTPYASIGTNLSPGNYTILESTPITDPLVGDATLITINLDLSPIVGTMSVGDIDTGLRLTTIFKDSVWKSGIWTNGIFDGGYFEGGIWYGGLFTANWGY